MTDVATLSHDQLVRIALAARALMRHCQSSSELGIRLHRGEDEWRLLGALSGELPATEKQKAGRSAGRRPDPAVQARRDDVLRMIRDGATVSDAAETCGVSRMTVYRWMGQEA
jgi:DNA-binding NarL/FixJ family response regulator